MNDRTALLSIGQLSQRTGLPVRTWAATWALAGDALHADAVATGLFFDGGPALADRWGIEWVRVATDGRVEGSAGFPGEIFTAGRARRPSLEDTEE